MKTSRFVVLFGLLCGCALGKVEADLYGSYENVLSVQHVKKWTILDLNNLVFSAEGKLGAESFVHADAEATLPFGAVNGNLLDYIPDTFSRMVPDSLRDAYGYRLEPSVRISNAYISMTWNKLTVRLGKQPLAWGTGYVWNPTEIISPKLAYDPSYRRDGENALKVAYSWRYGGGVELVGVLRGDIDSITAIARIKENLAGFDISAVGAWLWDSTLTPGTVQSRVLAGGQFKGDIAGIGVWAEGGYNIYEEDSLSYAEFVAGCDYTFTFRTHVMAEYLHYGRGFASPDDYTSQAWFERAWGGRKALGRHLVYLGADQTVISFHSLGVGTILNLTDFSGMVIPRLSLNLADNLDLSLYGFLSFGDEQSEYGGAPIQGGILRLTGYF